MLTFAKAYPQLDKLRQTLVEFDELDYTSLLNPDEVKEVDRFKESLLNFIIKINSFHPETDASFNKNVRDALENEIEGFFRNTTKRLRDHLVFLRQEAALKSQDQQSLAEEQKATIQAREQYKELSQQLKSELESLQKQKREVEAAHGEVATTYLAVQFSKQAVAYESAAEKWLARRNKLYRWLIAIISINFFFYFFLFFLEKTLGGLPPSEIFTIEYGVVKLALLAVLSYGVGFTSKNYNVNSHLAAVNKHRSNVAQTLDDFFATNPERKSHMLQEGTRAMFRHVPIGYIRREEQRDNGPFDAIIRTFSPNKE